MDTEPVTVTVAEGHLGRIDAVVSELREHGMQVEQVLTGLGLVTGQAADLAALRELTGVTSVDAAQQVQLPPPDAEVQ